MVECQPVTARVRDAGGLSQVLRCGPYGFRQRCCRGLCWCRRGLRMLHAVLRLLQLTGVRVDCSLKLDQCGAEAASGVTKDFDLFMQRLGLALELHSSCALLAGFLFQGGLRVLAFLGCAQIVAGLADCGIVGRLEYLFPGPADSLAVHAGLFPPGFCMFPRRAGLPFSQVRQNLAEGEYAGDSERDQVDNSRQDSPNDAAEFLAPPETCTEGFFKSFRR